MSERMSSLKRLKKLQKYYRVLGFYGAGCALWASLTRTIRFFKVSQADAQHPFWLRLPSSDVATYKQVFIDVEYDFSVTSSPKIIVDGGANIGLASICFANRFPAARIFAIEPERSNFELLTRNVAPYSNVTPIHAALWNRDGEINLVDPGLGHWGFMTEEPHAGDSDRNNSLHSVRAVSVPTLMTELGIDRIDIFKIDVEGAEKELFKESAVWIDLVDALIIELHERMKPGCNRSFYNNSNGFDTEWYRGENIYLSRGGRLSAPR